jgi:hypothetical protein
MSMQAQARHQPYACCMCACSWCCCSCCGCIQLLLLLSPRTAARGCSIHTAPSACHFLPAPSQPKQSRDHCLQAQHDTARHTKAWHDVANIRIQLHLAPASQRKVKATACRQQDTARHTPQHTIAANHEHDPCEHALTTWDTRRLLFRFSTAGHRSPRSKVPRNMRFCCKNMQYRLCA